MSRFCAPMKMVSSLSRWSPLAARSLLFIGALVSLEACDVAQLKEFFQAKPTDTTTSLEVDTAPAIGKAVPGSVDLDGKLVSDKTPFKQQPILAGKHQLRVSAKGFITQEMEI